MFNSFDDPAEQLDQARTFVRKRRHESEEQNKSVNDLLVFYAGHGDFEGDGRDFYLTIRRTHRDHPLLTSITARSLGSWVRQNARDLRTYLIIDCCFAAALHHGFQTSPLGLAELRLNEALPDPAIFDNDDAIPTAGVALLAAAGLNDAAIADPSETYTRFTTSVLEILRDGDERLQAFLSLDDLHRLVYRRINERFPEGSRPELRSLQQTRGRVELVRLFPNPAFRRLESMRLAEQAARLEEEKCLAEEAARVAEEKRKAEEAARLAEEERKAEEAARLAEEKHKAEKAARLAEEKRKAEEAARLVEEKHKAEEAARLAEERRRTEEAARLVVEQRKAEEVERQAEAKPKPFERIVTE